MLRCKISSVNDNACPGGPVSSNNGATERSEYVANGPTSRSTFALLNFASSRAQSFVFARTTARRILQHCTCEDCSFCFAGLEWNGHSVCALATSIATAANAQWFEIAIHEQIAIATPMPPFTLRSIVEAGPILKSFPVNRESARLSRK